VLLPETFSDTSLVSSHSPASILRVYWNLNSRVPLGELNDIDMTSVCGLLTWAGIAFTYIRFYNTTVAQGIDRSTLPYRSPLQPYAAYYALVFCCIILFFNGWSVFYTGGDPAPFDTATLITSYLPIVFVPILYFGYSFWRPQPTLAVQSIDFYGGSRDVRNFSFSQRALRS
jgi:amino acid transporter